MIQKFYLASASPRRRELLATTGVAFEVFVPKTPEKDAPKTTKAISPGALVKEISLGKLMASIGELNALKHTERTFIVLSADTLVFQNGKVLSKPKNPKAAAAMLRKLSGEWHEVFTGVCLAEIRNGKIIKRRTISVKTKVKFAKLTEKTIQWYVASGEPLDKAGAYGAQGIGAAFVEKIQGSYTNVVGLPMVQTLRELNQFSSHQRKIKLK